LSEMTRRRPRGSPTRALGAAKEFSSARIWELAGRWSDYCAHSCERSMSARAVTARRRRRAFRSRARLAQLGPSECGGDVGRRAGSIACPQRYPPDGPPGLIDERQDSPVVSKAGSTRIGQTHRRSRKEEPLGHGLVGIRVRRIYELTRVTDTHQLVAASTVPM
jgi:hypothetical protein